MTAQGPEVWEKGVLGCHPWFHGGGYSVELDNPGFEYMLGYLLSGTGKFIEFH